MANDESPAGGEEKKVFVDEDWKSKVRAEKEAAAQAEQAGDAGAAPQQPASPDPSAASHQLPPASFITLCSTLATQAMLAMGQMANPVTNEVYVDLEQAKHFIDTLAVLEEKTKGNLTAEESTLLTNLLHEFRLAFVAVQSQPQSAPETSGN